MIKRYVLLFMAINVTSLYAILGGVGINFAQDSFTLDAETFSDEALSLVPITRTEISAPMGVGGFAYLTVIPFIDLEAGASLTFSTYEYSFTDPVDGEKNLELGLGKFTWHVSAQRPLLKLPMIRMYAGAGVNGSTYTKIVSEDLVKDLSSDCFNDEDCMKEELAGDATGMHLEAGARFKPPILPFSLNINARYNLVKDIAPDSDGFLTISVGAAFAI